MDNERRFPNEVRKVLESAGWFPERNVTKALAQWRNQLVDKGGFEMFPAAERALLEFGGLTVDQHGPGVTCSREPFNLDPLLAMKCEDVFAEYSAGLGKMLFPLGEAVDGHMFIAIAETGEVYLFMDDVLLAGADINSALTNLIIGNMPAAVDLDE